MELHKFLQFLRNPSESTYTKSPSLYVYLQSSPITPLIDVYTAYVALVLLLFDGLPISKILHILPHLFNRREQHAQTHIARLRVFFAVLWSLCLLTVFPRVETAVTFAQCVVGLVLLCMPLVARLYLGSESEVANQDFNSLVEKYGIDTQRVDELYTRASNLAIWTHFYVLVEPFAQLLFVDIWFHPLLAPWHFIQRLGTHFIGVLFIGLLTTCMSYVYFAFLECMWPTYGGNSRHIMYAGTIGSAIYGVLIGTVFRSRVEFMVWVVSDLALWAGGEGLREYQMLMSRDDFGAYLHSEQCRKDIEERERLKREKEKKTREGEEFKQCVEGLHEEDREFLGENQEYEIVIEGDEEEGRAVSSSQ